MRTVNEIIYGSRMHERTAEEQSELIETLRNIKDGDRYANKTVDRAAETKIRNFGETAALETIGCVGIYLSQFGDKIIDEIVLERKRRNRLRTEI